MLMSSVVLKSLVLQSLTLELAESRLGSLGISLVLSSELEGTRLVLSAMVLGSFAPDYAQLSSLALMQWGPRGSALEF